jgi:peptide/nickel transport system substrate-binding protein
MKPKVLLLLFIVTASYLYVSCDLGNSSQENILTIAVRADVTGIYPNPPTQPEAFTIDVNSNVFEGLVRFGKNMNPEPAVAETWENRDDVTWIFHLRKKIRFSNGDYVKADDVVASIETALNRPFTTASFLQHIKSVRALSSDTVEIKTHYPYPILLSQLTVGFIMPKKVLQDTNIPPIGTGPYKVKRWVVGKQLDLERNRYYHGDAPTFNQIRFVVEPSGAKRIKALLEKKTQMADYIPLEEVDRLSRIKEIKIINRPGTRVLFLTFRMDRPPFNDIRLRQAVELGIDREELIRRALFGKAAVASQLVPPQVAGYNPEITIPKNDRNHARQLIQEAGYTNGFSIRLDGTKDRYVNDVQILNEIASQLESIGIKVSVNPMPKTEFFPFLAAGKSDFTLVGFSCDTLYASLALDTMMRSPRPGTRYSQNFQGLADPVLDQLIDQAWHEPSLKNRTAIYAQALKRISEIHAIVPLEIQPETIALSREIDWEPPITFALRVYDASFARD